MNPKNAARIKALEAENENLRLTVETDLTYQRWLEEEIAKLREEIRGWETWVKA